MLGWVDIRRPTMAVVTTLLNFLCVAVAVDFVYRGHFMHPSTDLSFSRLGYVDTSSARIVVRAPEMVVVELRFHELDPDSPWSDVYEVTVSKDSDFTGTFVLQDLHPDTEYEYHTNANHRGKFRTAAPDLKKWTLVSTSCIKPFYPYSPTDHALRVKGLEHLGRFITERSVEFMLFLGDFIYIDLPYPLGWSREHYTTLYRQVYASPSWSASLRSLPWIHVYDDHEIVNDWSANETGLYNDALQPYWDYQGFSNPHSKFGDGESYYTFEHGDVAFFVMDTRRYRSDSSLPDGPEKTMLGEKQLHHLEDWLRTEPAWKVVVSGVPFTRNWRGPDAVDCWAGYLWEREIVFQMMRATNGVIILSGDRHEHATTVFPAPGAGGTGIIEFSTSALNQFYEPFDRFHREIEKTDQSISNFYKGNSKFAALSFDTSDPAKWVTHFELVIDGEVVWSYNWEVERLTDTLNTK
ncbi:PhoD-like phosphatase [Xylariales sp. PMI_506]|nr:PhoD-like phosphatase [Xylariales sp. PMI_506]